jgi:hypothetical protein
VEWQVTLPCLPSMVPVARRLARALLADCSRLDDAELVLGELYANAVRYGRGEITVSVVTQPGWARLAVSDWGPDLDLDVDLNPCRKPGLDTHEVGEPPAAVAEQDGCHLGRNDHVGRNDLGGHDLADGGYGLLIVGILASRWGHDHDLDGLNTIWAELEW